MVDNHESFAEFLWTVSEANLETNALHEFEKTKKIMFFNNGDFRPTQIEAWKLMFITSTS